MNEEQKKARLEKWQEAESPFYRRWRVYSTFFTGFAIGLFYVVLISNKALSWLGPDGHYAIVLVFSGILGGVIYTIVVDGHVEMPEFIESRGDRFRAGLFGDILLGIAGAIVLDFIRQQLEIDFGSNTVKLAAEGIVGGYGGRAILQFALERVFKDINFLEADRQAYLQANLQRQLARMDSLELIDLVNQHIKVGLVSSELNPLVTEIEQTDSAVRQRIFRSLQDFRLAAKTAGATDRIERIKPLLEALIKGDVDQHAYYAELAFAYKDSGSPDLFQAMQYLNKAIALREKGAIAVNSSKQLAETWNYELSRAITQIEIAHQETSSYDFGQAVHERIIADLLAVAEIYNLENILKAVSNESMPAPILHWMRRNQAMLATHPRAKVLLEQLNSLMVEPPSLNAPSAPPQNNPQTITQTSPSNVTPSNSVPAAGIQLIKTFEGYAEKLPDGRAKAYPDAIYGWEVPTVGYGTTKYPNGKKVQQGDIITHTQAEEYLLAEIEHSCKRKLEAIPTWAKMNENQRSALYSFAYNLGSAFYSGSNFASITRVCDFTDKWPDKAWIAEQFIKYRNPGTPAEAGLRRRRLAEANLFCEPISVSNNTSNNTAPVDTIPTEPTETDSSDISLSEHFKLSELIFSETAARYGIDNYPYDTEAMENLKAICHNILEPVRSHFNKPIMPSSGYRSPALNDAIRGSATSQHMVGEAVDFKVPDVPIPDVCSWINNNLEFDQLIMEYYDARNNSGWVHCSYRRNGGNRHEFFTIS